MRRDIPALSSRQTQHQDYLHYATKNGASKFQQPTIFRQSKHYRAMYNGAIVRIEHAYEVESAAAHMVGLEVEGHVASPNENNLQISPTDSVGRVIRNIVEPASATRFCESSVIRKTDCVQAHRMIAAAVTKIRGSEIRACITVEHPTEEWVSNSCWLALVHTPMGYFPRRPMSLVCTHTGTILLTHTEPRSGWTGSCSSKRSHKQAFISRRRNSMNRWTNGSER